VVASRVPKRNKRPTFLPQEHVVPAHVAVPAEIRRPSYALSPSGKPRALAQEEYAEVKSERQIEQMRGACGLAADALALACEVAREGVTTDEVDRVVAEFLIARGGYPAGINYHGFPRGLCASPNEVVLHGIPNTRPLESGDIVNFDVTVYYDGAFGDCSAMVCVGDVDDDALRLVDAVRRCLLEAVALVGPGVKLNAVGDFCTRFAKEQGFSVVAEFCGHFIGSEMHMRPNVVHVPNGNDLELRPGNTFTIEPILIEGDSAELVGPLDDGWTYVSKSGGWSAQWEHTLLVTKHGAEVLTTTR